jgi:hypothetical protein
VIPFQRGTGIEGMRTEHKGGRVNKKTSKIRLNPRLIKADSRPISTNEIQRSFFHFFRFFIGECPFSFVTAGTLFQSLILYLFSTVRIAL